MSKNDSPIHSLFLEEDEQAGGWLVTYADLVTLLLVFFLLLYSMSTLNLERFKNALASIQVSLNEDRPAAQLIRIAEISQQTNQPFVLERASGLRTEKKDILQDLTEYIEEENLGDHIIYYQSQGRIIIQIRGAVLFGSGQADINRTAFPILGDISTLLEEYADYSINIKGHTDNQPIATAQFPSNWELSAVRATSVLKFFISEGIDARRLTATGYGDLMPLVPNTTPANRAQNRRVEFVLEKQEPWQ